MIVGPEKMGFIVKHEKKKHLDYYLEFHNEMDLVLTEGFKSADKPKIEIYRKENRDYLLCSEEELLAVVSDDEPPIEMSKPVFGFQDIFEIVDFLEERFLK
jgi:molybdopterin-guanine dinucleotide biosynthesis protein B